jgi:hypothetical protein
VAYLNEKFQLHYSMAVLRNYLRNIMTERRTAMLFGYILHHLYTIVCLTTDTEAFPKRVLHTVRSSASSFNLQYPLFSLKSSNSW